MRALGIGDFATVLLFGSMPPERWGPPPDDPRHTVLWRGPRGLADIGVDEVYAAAHAQLAASAGGLLTPWAFVDGLTGVVSKSSIVRMADRLISLMMGRADRLPSSRRRRRLAGHERPPRPHLQKAGSVALVR
jgi:hypothetical protein